MLINTAIELYSNWQREVVFLASFSKGEWRGHAAIKTGEFNYKVIFTTGDTWQEARSAIAEAEELSELLKQELLAFEEGLSAKYGHRVK